MSGEHSTRTRGPRLLWGRVAFYGLSLALVFALGAWSAGDDTADAELEEARAEVERLSQENMHLRAERDALEAGGALDAEEASTAGGDDADESVEADPDEDAAGDTDPDDGDAGDTDQGDGETGDAEQEDTATEAEAADAGAGDTGDPAESGTYVVREGDTGRSIAETVYGDQDLWPLIAEANDLDGANALQVDQELVIPPPE